MADENAGFRKFIGYPKWSKDNTSTVANDPANEINRAKNEPEKEAPGVTFNKDNTATVNDGTTGVVVSHLNKPEIPDFGPLGKEKQHYPPCINPTCKSFGKSHPNCLCYAGPGGSSLEQGFFASGGCVRPHNKSCEHYADGGQVESQTQFLNNPSLAIEHAGAHHGLLHSLTKLGTNGRSDNEHKYLDDYKDAAFKGHRSINAHVKKLIGKEKLELKPDEESREALKKHLDSLNINPEKALDIGGNIGKVLPDHAAALGSHVATALNYLTGLKPKGSQSNPLDPVVPATKASHALYNRQLDIAQNPNLALQHVKNGTIQPVDLNTLKTIYPNLHTAMVQKAGEALIDAKANGMDIPRRTKQGLSDFLGQPLDFVQTPAAMQAIIKANTPPMQAQAPQKKPKKASGVELDQIDKTESNLATPDQARLMDKKE
jgi:hypothetical protein